jgi:hypothetical protein
MTTAKMMEPSGYPGVVAEARSVRSGIVDKVKDVSD